MSFVFQDHNIVPNLALQTKHPLRGWFSQVHAHERQFPQDTQLVWLTYWLDNRLWNKNAQGWRFTSFCIHFINSLLLASVSPLAAMLFFVHPLTLMGSSYVAGRSGSLSFTFIMLAVLALLNGWALISWMIAAIGSRWLKKDLIILFALLAMLWYTK